jgi:hypothetical protein
VVDVAAWQASIGQAGHIALCDVLGLFAVASREDMQGSRQGEDSTA